MKKSLARSWKKLADERLEDQSPTIPRGTKFWSLSKSERSALDEMFQTPALRSGDVIEVTGRRCSGRGGGRRLLDEGL